MRLGRSRRDRLITFLLLPAIVVSVLVLSGGSFRASFQLDKLREQAVVEASLELANERAGRLDQRIIEQDNVVEGELAPERLFEAGESWLQVAERQTPTVRAALTIDMSSDQHDVLLFASRAPGPKDDEFRHLILNQVVPQLELEKTPPGQLRHLHRNFGGQNYLFSYWQTVYRGRNLLTLAWHDVARIVVHYLPMLYGEKDQQSRVNVVDSQGRIIYGPPLSVGDFTVGRHFQTTLYKWRLNVALTRAEELAISAERRLMIEIVLAALSALVVIAGSVVVLHAAERERRLANLKSDFVANVSHELKTPLSLIRMFSELLQSGRVGSDEKRAQYLSIIVTESERLGGLIENVLDFARVERGEESYVFTKAPIEGVVSRAVEVCRLRGENQSITFDVSIEPELPALSIDERALEIALINLIDNAMKYASFGTWVGISARRAPRGGIDLIVADRGAGIPPEDRERIFERFVRRESTAGIRGSGIGLALVQHVAQAHRGSVWVEDNEPQGARFVLRIGT